MSNKDQGGSNAGDVAKESLQNQQPQPTVSSIACRSISVNTKPTVLKMSPPATLRNWKFHKPLLAVGNSSGMIQIFNLSSGKLYRELSVHSYPVLGIEWIGLNAFISFAVSDSFQNSDLNWELSVTELDTGRTVKLKSGSSSEGSVILSVKASHLRQYFIIIYKNQPFEIWDLETLSLLRRVPRKFSGIVAAEWSPLYSKKVEPANQSRDSKGSAPLRENFVVTNKMGELFHFSIAGNIVKEISKIPPESTMNKAVTAIAWKSDHVILGQTNGNISVWDLEQKESRTMCTMRGSIKKIRFAPGRGNMKVLLLFEDGVDIWDIRRLRLISTLSTARIPSIKIEDADWAASDRPVILTSDGSVSVMDIEFTKFSARTSNHHGGGSEGSIQHQRNDNVQSSNETCYLQ